MHPLSPSSSLQTSPVFSTPRFEDKGKEEELPSDANNTSPVFSTPPFKDKGKEEELPSDANNISYEYTIFDIPPEVVGGVIFTYLSSAGRNVAVLCRLASVCRIWNQMVDYYFFSSCGLLNQESISLRGNFSDIDKTRLAKETDFKRCCDAIMRFRSQVPSQIPKHPVILGLVTVRHLNALRDLKAFIQENQNRDINIAKRSFKQAIEKIDAFPDDLGISLRMKMHELASKEADETARPMRYDRPIAWASTVLTGRYLQSVASYNDLMDSIERPDIKAHVQIFHRGSLVRRTIDVMIADLESTIKVTQLTHFLLVAGGQTDWKAECRCEGQTDTCLNEKGRIRAETLAERLIQVHPQVSAIYSSDLNRAYDTAFLSAKKYSLPLFQEKDLREICWGEMEGLRPREGVRNTYQERCSSLRKEFPNWKERWNHPIMRGAESYNTLLNRVKQQLSTIAQIQPAGAKVLVFTHEKVIETISTDSYDEEAVAEVLGQEAVIKTRNYGVVHIAFDPDKVGNKFRFHQIEDLGTAKTDDR